MDNPVERADQIAGWMYLEELEWLYEAAKRMDSILELGCYKGRSTYVLLAGCPGMVHVADAFYCGPDYPIYGNEPSTYPAFYKNVGHFPNLGRVFEGTTVEAAESGFLPLEFDMVFIDADHSYEAVLADLRNWAPRAKKLICGHDYLKADSPGVQQALDEHFGPGKVSQGPGSLWYIDK